MNALKRLAPLVVIGLVGLWIWKGGGGLFPADRELIWQLAGDWKTVRSVEIQIWDHETLLKREELSFPAGLTQDLVQRVPLKEGTYQARVFVTREGAASQSWSQPIRVEGDSSLIDVAPGSK